MALFAYEKPESQAGQTGQSPSDELVYIVTGDPDPDVDNADVVSVTDAYALTQLPAVFNGNILSSLTRRRLSAGTWEYTGTYQSPGGYRDTGDKAFSFNTAGGTAHIIAGKHHVATYGATGATTTVQDGLIGATKDGVEGTDIDVSAFAFQVTLYVDSDDMTSDYVALLYALTDTVNANEVTISLDDVDLTFAEGECRLVGCQGAKRAKGDWELTLNFAAFPNKTSLTIGGISVAAKAGWDVVSVRTDLKEDSDNSFLAHKATFVFVDQVYDYENWTGLIPSD